MNTKRAGYIIGVQRTINMFRRFIDEKNRTYSNIEKLEKYQSATQQEKSEIIKQLNSLIDSDNLEVQREIDQEIHNLQLLIGATILRYMEDVENTVEYLENVDSIHDSKSSRIIREILTVVASCILGMVIYRLFK